MPRIVRFTQTASIKIDPNAPPGAPNAWPRDEQGNLKVISICACGISARFPFCDGAHKLCREEEAGHVYEYDIATRTVVAKTPLPPEMLPDAASRPSPTPDGATGNPIKMDNPVRE